MPEGKIHIKVGSVEVSYEGSEDYIKSELLGTVEKVKNLFNIEELPPTVLQQPPVQPPKPADSSSKINYAIPTIAARLGVTNGSDLIMASAAYLTFVQGGKEFTRKQLIETMKDATGYYKDTYVSNLTVYINGLVKNKKLNVVAKDTYSLPINVQTEMKSQLA